MPRLLPTDFDEQLRTAIRTFWASRANGLSSQGGNRGNVIAGKNLDGFLSVVQSISHHCGIPESCVHVKGRHNLTLPGYYRPSKNWDVVIVYKKRLLAVLEFKSQVGSFGNNFNNRTEEAIGSASDFWIAAQHGAYHPQNFISEDAIKAIPDPRPPFLGYLMLLEESESSLRPVATQSLHYNLFPVFERASYSDRYRVLCQRLMEQNLYNAAAVILSTQGQQGMNGEHRALSEATSARNLFNQLAAQLLAASEL